MKKKPTKSAFEVVRTETVKVPDYKPALIVTMLCFAAVTVASIFLMISIVSKPPESKLPATVALKAVTMEIDGHEYWTHGGSELTHWPYCDKCRKVSKETQ